MARTRTTGTLVSMYGSASQTRWVNPLPSTQNYGPSNTSMGLHFLSGTTITCIDNPVPSYYKRSKLGEVFINDLFIEKIESSTSVGGAITATVRNPPVLPQVNVVTFWSETGAKVRGCHLSNGPTTLSPSFSVTTAKQLAGTNAAANVVAPEVQGLVDLAEARKTLKMLANPIRELAKLSDRGYKRYIREMRRTSFKDRKSFQVWMASRWLEYRYGWIPLIKSIEGTVKALVKERKHQRQTARGSTNTPTQTGVRTHVDSDGIWRHTQTWNVTVENKVTAGVLYETNFSLASDLGFSIHELPSTAWELVPYSFVVDWLANVGDFIRAMTPKMGVRELGSWTTVWSKETTNVSNVAQTILSTDGSYYYGGGGTTWTLKRVRTTKTRTRGLHVGLVPKTQEITFQKPKDFKHAADAVALLLQKLSK